MWLAASGRMSRAKPKPPLENIMTNDLRTAAQSALDLLDRLPINEGYHDETVETLDALRAALAASQWQPIETAPQDGRKLMLSYRNRNNKTRTVLARWVTDDEAAETDADGVGLEGGWYECIDNWDEYSQVTIHEGEPSHWMPLPAPPSA